MGTTIKHWLEFSKVQNIGQCGYKSGQQMCDQISTRTVPIRLSESIQTVV